MACGACGSAAPLPTSGGLVFLDDGPNWDPGAILAEPGFMGPSGQITGAPVSSPTSTSPGVQFAPVEASGSDLVARVKVLPWWVLLVAGAIVGRSLK